MARTKRLTVLLREDYDNLQNTRFYDKGESLKVDENEYGDYYHLWVDNKLDLIPKKLCSILGRLN